MFDLSICGTLEETVNASGGHTHTASSSNAGSHNHSGATANAGIIFLNGAQNDVHYISV